MVAHALTRRAKLLLALFAGGALLRLLFLSPSRPLPRPLVSLTSTPQRLNTSLPPTLWSLTRQSLPPRRIRIHLPITGDDPTETAPPLAALDPIFRHTLIELRYVEDEGPATKYLPVVREAFERAAAAEEDDFSPLDEPVVVCDDDHVYSPVLVETLVKAWARKEAKAAVGLRGWRVRRDLHWGVGWDDVRRHVIEGWRLSESYQVGVLTANEGYLIAPSFFLPPSIRASLSSNATRRTFDRAALSSLVPLLNPPSSAPPSLHLVDDILLSGSLSSAHIPRYVVPLPPPEPPSLDITPPARTAEERDGGPRSPLEHHLREHGKSRNEANDEALRWFEKAWAAERAEGVGEMWFDVRGEAERRRGGFPGEPRWAGLVRRLWSQVSKRAYYGRVRKRWGEVIWWN